MNNKCLMVDYIDANVKASGIFGTFVWQGINGVHHSIDPPSSFSTPTFPILVANLWNIFSKVTSLSFPDPNTSLVLMEHAYSVKILNVYDDGLWSQTLCILPHLFPQPYTFLHKYIFYICDILQLL